MPAVLLTKPQQPATSRNLQPGLLPKHWYGGRGQVKRPAGLRAYANGAVFSDVELALLPSYPLVQRVSDDSESCLFEASFNPRHRDDPVVFHFLLPERFIPLRAKEPLIQPTHPFVSRIGERLSATYPVIGPATFRFWIEQLPEDRSLGDYDIQKLFHPDEVRSMKKGFEFNLGFFKAKLEET